jgi:hypothetical protein
MQIRIASAGTLCLCRPSILVACLLWNRRLHSSETRGCKQRFLLSPAERKQLTCNTARSYCPWPTHSHTHRNRKGQRCLRIRTTHAAAGFIAASITRANLSGWLVGAVCMGALAASTRAPAIGHRKPTERTRCCDASAMRRPRQVTRVVYIRYRTSAGSAYEPGMVWLRRLESVRQHWLCFSYSGGGGGGAAACCSI